MRKLTGRFLVRPRPYAGELVFGYLVRVASANGYENPRELCRVIRANRVSLRASLSMQSSELACLRGPFPRYCDAVSGTSYGLRRDDFNHYFMRWCPKCLSEGDYLRGEWGIKLCCVCARHGVKLTDRCPQCGLVQSLERCSISTCICGYRLGRALLEPVEGALVDLHHMLAQTLTCRSDELGGITPPIWVRMVKYLGPFNTDPFATRPGQQKRLHDLHVSLELAKGASCILGKWPSNFRYLLGRIREARPHATHIGDAFGPLYRVLYQDLCDGPLDFLRQEFETYLLENWFGLLGRRNRRLQPKTIAVHSHRPSGEIALAACASKAAVRCLASIGLIRGHAVTHASGRTTIAVHRDDAKSVSACKADSLSLREAAHLLGLRRERVRELIDAGLLRAWIDPRRTSASIWWLSKQDAYKLLSITELPMVNGVSKANMALATILRTWRLRSGEFPALVRALFAGDVTIASTTTIGRGMGRAGISTESLRSWLDAHRAQTSSWMSVDTAAKWLGVKQQVAYQLVYRGLLLAEEDNGIRRVSGDALEAFDQRYISLAELASSQGVAPRSLLATLSARPVCGPTVDGTRQYFYQRDEVAKNLAESHPKVGR